MIKSVIEEKLKYKTADRLHSCIYDLIKFKTRACSDIKSVSIKTVRQNPSNLT